MTADLLGSLSLSGVAGYVFLRWSCLKRFDIRRATGEHVVFCSVIAGISFVVLGHGVPVPEMTQLGFLKPYWTPLLAVVSAAVLAPTLNVVSRIAHHFGTSNPLIFPSWAAFERDAIIQEDPFVEVLSSREPLELTLRDGKTYIGFVVATSTPRSGVSRASKIVCYVVPVLSGYRDGQTQQLKLTTGYAALLQDEENWHRLEIVIPRSEITRARLFDLGLHVEGGFVSLSGPSE